MNEPGAIWQDNDAAGLRFGQMLRGLLAVYAVVMPCLLLDESGAFRGLLFAA